MTYGRVLEALIERWDDERSYARRPDAWVQERAQEDMTVAQKAICASVVEHRYTAVPSAHDLGKSFTASRIGAWWIDSHIPGEAFLVSTAPTAAQVGAILWREIGKVHRRAKLRGRITRAGYPQWHLNDELVGYGRKPADYEESAFQGIHARYVLVIMDEAGGIARHLFDAVDALATNEFARVLAVGNPDDAGSHFASVCKPSSGWNVIQLDGLRSPNMSEAAIIGAEADGFGWDNPRYPLTAALMDAEGIDFSDEVIPPQLAPMLLSPLWVEERLQRWGGLSRTAHIDLDKATLQAAVRRRAEQSPLIQAKVRGIFPTNTATGVIPLGWVQYAVNRWNDLPRHLVDSERGHAGSIDIAAMRQPSSKVVGVDVAYTGADETCIAIRHGEIVTALHRYRHADTQETAEYAAAHLSEPDSLAVVDVIGIGAGVYDSLRRWHRKANPVTGQRLPGRAIPFNASAASVKTDKIGEFRFRNDRAAAWWNMRELLDPSRGSMIALPDDERLIEELVAVKYEHLIGVIKVESKDEIKVRLGRSTDTADAVIQAFWTRAFSSIDALFPPDGDPLALQAIDRVPEVIRYPGYTPISQAGMDADQIGLDWLTRQAANNTEVDVWER